MGRRLKVRLNLSLRERGADFILCRGRWRQDSPPQCWSICGPQCGCLYDGASGHRTGCCAGKDGGLRWHESRVLWQRGTRRCSSMGRGERHTPSKLLPIANQRLTGPARSMPSTLSSQHTTQSPSYANKPSQETSSNAKSPTAASNPASFTHMLQGNSSCVRQRKPVSTRSK